MKKNVIIIVVIALIAVGAAAYFLFLSGPGEPKSGFYMPGDYFVTNIKGSERLVKVTLVLGISTPDLVKAQEQLTEVNHVIRDIIVFSLREKTEDELRADSIKETLNEELVKKLNEGLGIDYITTIYFNDFVIQ
ncbi:MAG: flagellar basal body-associated protein FliL [Burkholderiales bacterium]